MKNTFKRTKRILLFFLLVLMLCPTIVCATDYSCTGSIDVSVKNTGVNVSSGITNQIVLKPMDETTPMPENDSLLVVDNGNGTFGPITYTVPGDYKYIIYQVKGDKAYFTYDETVYTVTIRVVNDETNGGLKTITWANVNGKADKTAVQFENTYYKPVPEKTENPPVDTGDHGNILLWSGMLITATLALILLKKGKSIR